MDVVKQWNKSNMFYNIHWVDSYEVIWVGDVPMPFKPLKLSEMLLTGEL